MTQPALSVCKVCGGKVSTEAHACPHCGQPNPSSGAEAWTAEARSLLATGRKIDAIKVVREATGMGLKEAKELVASWT